MQLEKKTITLPVSGWTATIKEADGYADKILFSKRLNLHKTYPEYWAYCTEDLNGKKPTAEDINSLLVPDQQFLALEIYKLSYGSELGLKGACPHCGKSLNTPVNLDKLPLRPIPAGATPPDPTWEVKLPRTKKKVVYGYITFEKDMEDVDAPFDPNRDIFKCIRTISNDEKKDGQPSYEDIVNLPVKDLKALRNTMMEKATGYDTHVKTKCNSCDKGVEINILMDPSFLFGGM
jgi:hypothetical protein